MGTSRSSTAIPSSSPPTSVRWRSRGPCSQRAVISRPPLTPASPPNPLSTLTRGEGEFFVTRVPLSIRSGRRGGQGVRLEEGWRFLPGDFPKQLHRIRQLLV